MAKEVEAVILEYFDALHFADAEAMGRIMHPRAVYATADEDPPLVRDVNEYLEVLQRRTSPFDKGEKRTDEILSVELAGQRTAMARVRCSIGERQFTDFLSLIKCDDGWRIIAKVFSIELQQKEA